MGPGQQDVGLQPLQRRHRALWIGRGADIGQCRSGQHLLGQGFQIREMAVLPGGGNVIWLRPPRSAPHPHRSGRRGWASGPGAWGPVFHGRSPCGRSGAALRVCQPRVQYAGRQPAPFPGGRSDGTTILSRRSGSPPYRPCAGSGPTPSAPRPPRPSATGAAGDVWAAIVRRPGRPTGCQQSGTVRTSHSGSAALLPVS